MKKFISFVIACTLLMSSLAVSSSAIGYNKHRMAVDEINWVITAFDGLCPYYFTHEIKNAYTVYADWDTDWNIPNEVPKDEFESFLFTMATEEYLTRTGFLNEIRRTFNYDETKGIYYVPYGGGFGGFSPADYEYWGYKEVGNGVYDIVYRRRNIKYAPDELTWELAEEIGFNDQWQVEWNGEIWEVGAGDFYQIASYENYGYIYRVDLNGDSVTFVDETTFENGAPFEFDEEPVLVIGDLNDDGKTNSKDISALLKYLAGTSYDIFYETCGDYNRDGNVNAKDISAMLKAAAKGEL